MTSFELSAAPIAWAPPLIGAHSTTTTAATAASATPTAGPRATPGLARRRQWERWYRHRLELTDAIIAIATTAAATLPSLLMAGSSVALWDAGRVALVTAVTWMLLLAALQTRDARITGSGAAEYVRVIHATALAFGILAIAFVVFGWQGLHDQLVIALPIGFVALLLGRRAQRRWLVRQRQNGQYRSRAIVVGRRPDVEHVIGTLQRDGQLGYHVVGTALDGDSAAELVVASRTIPAGRADGRDGA